MQHTTKTAAILLLADGTIFHGKSIGISGKTFGEVCFNTGMTGYQEIFTDPSYFGQIMVATNPHIGNYGVNVNEVESDKIMISGLVCKNFSFNHSRPDSESNLYDYFSTQNLICISDVDTRALVSYIRDNGAQNAVICTDGSTIEDLKKQRQDKEIEYNELLNKTEKMIWLEELNLLEQKYIKWYNKKFDNIQMKSKNTKQKK